MECQTGNNNDNNNNNDNDKNNNNNNNFDNNLYLADARLISLLKIKL